MALLSTRPSARERTAQPTPSVLVDLPLVFLLAHLVLGPILAQWSAAASFHAYVTVVIAVSWAAFGRKLERVVAAAGYVAMCDVLWRDTGAVFFHEGGKYVVTAVLLVAWVRFMRAGRGAALPLAYLALLLPSALLTVAEAGSLAGAREPLSVDLSGPITLAVSAVFFLQIRCSWRELRHVFVIMLGPITALASGVTYIIMTEDIVFAPTSATELATTDRFAGVFGPTRASAVLGLGALICLLLLLRERRNVTRLIELTLGLLFFGTSVLTFSRSGAFDFMAAGGVALLLQLARGRAKTLAILGLVVVAGLVVFSQLDAFTGGALEQRFTSRSTTGRSEIAQTDLDIWKDHRLAGVGPGRSAEFRREEFANDPNLRNLPALVDSHTEFTRVLAAHGMLGLLAMVCLFALAGRAVITAPNSWSRTVTIALILWAFADMTHVALRFAAPSFIFGLAMTRIVSVPRAGSEPPPA